MIRKLHQVILPSADLDRSVTFYRDVLGATLIARFDPSLHHFAIREQAPTG